MSAERHTAWAGRVSSDLIAIGGPGTRSFGALCLDVQRAAALLPDPQDAGERRTGVLIACTDRYLFTVGLLACWSRGHAAVLPASHRPGSLSEVEDSEGVVATVHDGEAERGFDLRAVLEGVPKDAACSPPRALGASEHVLTLFTSGSTGAPEPIAKRAGQLLGEVDVLARCFGADMKRALCTLPPRHIYGLLFGVLLPLRAGAAFVRETPLHTDVVLDLIRRHRVDTLIGVPAHLQGLEGASREACGSLRRVFSSGAKLRSATFEALAHGLELSVIEVLGSTETGGIGYRAQPGEAYRPFEGVSVEAGPDGQMLLRSPRLAPELAQPHACEDRVVVLPSGAFEHLGREGDVVKVGGTRVSLATIEQRVRALPGIRDVALIARAVPGARNQEILLAAVGDGWDAARMRSALSAWLEPVALPRRFRFASELPREPTGKLRREALLALFERPQPGSGFEWGARERTADRVCVRVRAPAELVYFRGHFEQWPVLPGVVQLGVLAVREALAAWPDLHALRRVRRLKFKQPIEPGQTLELALARLDDNRVDFSIEHEGAACSSGSLLFGPREER